ncbi:hypothetical protein DITRI_Ditri06bG0167500 [Diplodiscus trichospermus]
MACFISISFPVHLCSLRNPLKGRYTKKSAFCRLPGLASTKTASYFLAPCSSNECKFSVSRQHYLVTLSKHLDEIISCSLNVSPCIVIMGYWVGPDIDDGWGFVEASIDRSS